jgi:predicted nucleic acid-binding protein
MPTTSRIYWDSSCFISLLNAREEDRALACKDVLRHAEAGAFEIWTSTFTIAEVIKPKKKYEPKDLPAWAEVLRQTDEKGAMRYPGAPTELEKVWHYYHRNTGAIQTLAPEILRKIKGMFAWDYLHLVQLTPAIALHASDLSRDTGLKPADAVHAASALARKCSTLQRYDRHFDRVQHLIDIAEPAMITQPPPLFRGIEPTGAQV